MANKKEEIINNEEEVKTAVEETAVSSDEKVEEVKPEEVKKEEKTEKVKEEEKVDEEEKTEEKENKEETKKSKNESSKVKLKVLIPFTDKYTEEKYKLNSVITVSKERATELLKDKRKLVEKQN